MKVLVTGGAGYIGTVCVKALEDAGHQVVIFDNLSSSEENPQQNHSALYKGDIRNKHDIESVLAKVKFNAVIHLAAKAGSYQESTDPGSYYDTNILGSIQLFETCRKNNIKTLLFMSSSDVYSKTSGLTPISEGTICAPDTIYGYTKRVIEQQLEDYTKAYGSSTVIIRSFEVGGAMIDNSAGENHSPERHLIPQLINATLNPLENKFTDLHLNNAYDFVHVLDLAKAVVLALEYAEFEKGYQIFNLGSGTATPLNQIIDSIERISSQKLNIPIPTDTQQILARIANIEKTQTILGWKPDYSSLDTIIQTAYHWHKKQHKKTEK